MSCSPLHLPVLELMSSQSRKVEYNNSVYGEGSYMFVRGGRRLCNSSWQLVGRGSCGELHISSNTPHQQIRGISSDLRR